MDPITTPPITTDMTSYREAKENALVREKLRTLILVCILGLTFYFYYALNQSYNESFAEPTIPQIQRGEPTP